MSNSLVEIGQYFRGAYCHCHQGSDDPDDGGSKQSVSKKQLVLNCDFGQR